VPALARLWLRSAIAGFGPLLPPGYRWPPAHEVEDRIAGLVSDREIGVLVADAPDGLSGYIAYSASRDADASGRVGEVRTLFVDPSGWSRGVGGALLRRALAELRARGFTEATVWSFAANPRANALYEKHGLRRDGATRRQSSWASIEQVRYRLSLDDARRNVRSRSTTQSPLSTSCLSVKRATV
jgi:GNAT superfamily N-acetyltransferase